MDKEGGRKTSRGAQSAQCARCCTADLHFTQGWSSSCFLSIIRGLGRGSDAARAKGQGWWGGGGKVYEPHLVSKTYIRLQGTTTDV